MKKKAKCKADINWERLLPILCIEMVLRSKYLNNKFLISGPIVNSVGGGEETHTLKKVDAGIVDILFLWLVFFYTWY